MAERNISSTICGNVLFDHHTQDSTIFRSRFIQFCTANNVHDEFDRSGVRRRALLLTSLAENTYRVVKDLVFPDDLDIIPFKQLIKKLNNNFSAKKCTFAERYTFYKAEQHPGEDLVEWAARVRRLSQFCGFKVELENALRDRFVLGLENIKEKEKLFAENIEVLTFDRALEIAQSVRCARQAIESTQHRDRTGSIAGSMSQSQPVFALQRRQAKNSGGGV